MMSWLRKHPVAPFLVLQVSLCSWHLNLLSPWGDEVTSLETSRLDVPGLVNAAARDIHPPLYYFLLHFWQGIPFGLDPVVQARLLSVVFLVVATVAVDRLWAQRLPASGRIVFLVLWSLSPCLLLYSRMCRSYSLQLLAGVVAAAWIRNYAEKGSRKTQILLAGSLTAAMYTHYVPGIALLAAANLMLIRKRRWRAAVQIDAAVGLACLPWIGWLWQSIYRWSHQQEVYLITGRSALELGVKLAYWFWSFAMGEAQPDVGFVAGILLTPLIVWLLVAGIRRERDLSWIAIVCTVIGFIGVARWVSYPFLPARMLFTYPLLLLLAVRGGLFHRRVGIFTGIAVVVLSMVGIACYFQKTGFRNKEYPMPVREIAATIEEHSTAADSAVLVDSTNSDQDALEYALSGSRRYLKTVAPEATAEVRRLLADPGVRSIWFLRNSHDISPDHLDDRFERQIGAVMLATIHPYERFSPLERWMMRRVGIDPAPVWFHELLEYRR